MKIKTIYANPEQFEITKLTGGYLGGAQKVTVKNSHEQYTLKSMGNTSKKISRALPLLKHIQEFGRFCTHMAHLVDWEILDDGTLFTLFEYIENTEDRLATISEMIQISTESFLASKQYDFTQISPEVDYTKTTLHEIKNNGIERYSDTYFLPYITEETEAVIDWMSCWANYFIHDMTFRQQYLACAGFIHRDIHRHNIVIRNQEPYLIDFDFCGIDCRLIEITRPTNVYIEPHDFMPMYTKAKEVNAPHFSETEQAIIDRVLVLDIMANLGWEANEIYQAEEGEYKNEIIDFLQKRLFYLHQLMTNRKQFNLDFV